MEKSLNSEKQEDVLERLEQRFLKHMERHPKIEWVEIEAKIKDKSDLLWTLYEMERTGGEPDVVGNTHVFMDCSAESPKGRRSVCYDRGALESRKKNKPENDALTMAEEIGIELLTEEEYRALQEVGEFDLKSSSWVKTPESIRELGGAIFCDRRYNTVFTYHNGADSYYSARGFRGKLEI